jgi:hypothetical protein
MPITKTIAEVKEMLPRFISNISATASLPNFDTPENKYLVPLVGIALYNDIHTKYNADPQTLSDDDKVLIKKMRLVAVAYAYKSNIGFAQATLTDNGARKITPHGTENLFKWEFKELKDTLTETAFDATEVLLNYLFEKKPALWTESDAYKKINALLIKTGTEFNDQYDLYQPMRTYFSIRSVIADVQERYIKAGIGKELLKYLMELESPEEEEKECIDFIKKSLAFFSIKHAAKRYPIRISDQGFTILSGEGDKDSTEQGRVGADIKAIDVLVEDCELGGQDYLGKAIYGLAALYKKELATNDFKTALEAGPLNGYVSPEARTSGNENRKGIFRL